MQIIFNLSPTEEDAWPNRPSHVALRIMICTSLGPNVCLKYHFGHMPTGRGVSN